jgi:hypothetical protein
MFAMTTFSKTVQLMGLAAAMLAVQACQRAEQPATEAEPAAPAAAAPSQTASQPAASAPAASTPKPATTAAAPKPAAPAPAATARALSLAAGTALKVRTTRTLSTKTLQSGDSFEAVLDEPLVAGGRELFPKGATVMGRVVESDPGGRVKGVASMTITLNMLHGADGQAFDISTNTISVQADASVKKDATKVAIATGVGAAIGAIAGGGKGAGIGAATGAGAGTGVVLATRGDAAEIPSETVLDFSLASPVTVNR